MDGSDQQSGTTDAGDSVAGAPKPTEPEAGHAVTDGSPAVLGHGGGSHVQLPEVDRCVLLL